MNVTRGREKEEASGWGPDPPCRRKEAKYRREAAWGLSDEGNGYGYWQDFRGCGADPAEERRIPIETGFCPVGKFEQVSNSGSKDRLKPAEIWQRGWSPRRPHFCTWKPCRAGVGGAADVLVKGAKLMTQALC